MPIFSKTVKLIQLCIMKKIAFQRRLLKWHKEQNLRQMPWKGEKDPYKVWLSEIILQQTRVEQGMAYYQNFTQAFPNIQSLANAHEDTVYKLWEGLGYYSRCKNMLKTARLITLENKGKFPDTYDGLVKLPGIGPYTAAAIASFCFSLPYPVMDGNVFRVLARVFKINLSSGTSEGKKYFSQLAGDLLDHQKPGLYNQALMDFGATVCKHALPLCVGCIFQNSCGAYLENKVSDYPVKSKKIKLKERWFTWFIFCHRGKIYIQKRTSKDIWENLFEFYLLETNQSKDWSEKAVMKWLASEFESMELSAIRIYPAQTQKLTHQLIHARFIEIMIQSPIKPQKQFKGNWVSRKQLDHTGFPAMIRNFLEKSIMLS